MWLLESASHFGLFSVGLTSTVTSCLLATETLTAVFTDPDEVEDEEST